ncbi:SRPBCC family protein [Piscicoccus intestinalis]|uniref:SRPBCC family protein n=1 Tax=Piscicoccus intestinalis TaxID=746033 RepID=UPI00083878F3|nr:SRPBCC family protein [Piscicoccus intestinalis]
MPKPYASGVVPVSVEAVWELVRPFDGLPQWHPTIAQSRLTQGEEGQVGAVRRLELANGAVVVERLVTLDDAATTFSYEFVENPFDVRRYVSTLRLAPVTDTGHTFVQWWGEYDADASVESEMTPVFRDDVYAAGITALQRRFS